MNVDALVSAIESETETISALASVIAQQRDFMRSGDAAALQEITKQLQDLSFDFQAQENARDKAASALAADLGCEKKVSVFCGQLEKTDGDKLRAAGAALSRAVNALKAETKILSRLIEEGQKYNDMLLSEWRRLEGEFSRFGLREHGGMDIQG